MSEKRVIGDFGSAAEWKRKDLAEVAKKIRDHPPLFAGSFSDGILIAALTRRDAPSRVRGIVGSIGYCAIGQHSHINDITKPVARSAIATYHYSAPDDVWVRKLAENAQMRIQNRIDDFFTSSSRKVVIVFTGLGLQQAGDELTLVDIDGKVFFGLRYVVTPSLDIDVESDEPGPLKRMGLARLFAYRAEDTMDEAMQKILALGERWRQHIAKHAESEREGLESLVWEVGKFSRATLQKAVEHSQDRPVKKIFWHGIVEMTKSGGAA